MNSVLQLLQPLCLSWMKRHVSRDERVLSNLLVELWVVMQARLDADSKGFFDAFNQTLLRQNKHPFVLGRHADAHEFFACLIDVLESEDKSFTSDLKITERIWLECQTCAMKWQAAQDDVTQCIALKLDSLRETVTLDHVISQYCRWSLAPNLQCIICPSQTQSIRHIK